MAITILNTPPAYVPVYNPIYIKVSSNQTAKEGFNFLFDLYVNNTFVTRTNLLPRPGTTQAIYSPARILESYVNYDLTHNIVTDQVSTNCIDKYKIVFGEEYVVYWLYDSIAKDTITSTSYTILTSTIPHGYAQDDDIVITQDPGFTYAQINGIHKVVTVIDANTILINVTWPDLGTTLIQPGKTTWSDKRKTEFLTDSTELVDRYFQDLGDWSTYGPDGSGNKIEISPLGSLNWTQYNSGTMTQKYTEAIGTTLKPGATYSVTYTVFDTYPALGPQTTYVTVGGTQGTINSGTGTFSQLIKCGPTTEFRLFGNSSGGGLQGITFSQVSVALIGFEGYDWNAVVSYEDVPTFDYTRYQIDDTVAGRFLTKQPSVVLTRLEDRGSLGFLNVNDYALTPTVKYYMVVIGYNFDDSFRIPLSFELTTMEQVLNPSNASNRIIEIPAYPWNLNQLSQSIFSIDVIDSTVAKYQIGLFAELDPIGDPGNYTPMSEIKTFQMDYNCSKYDNKRFMFKNSLGQFDYFNATLLSNTTINATRDTYVKTLGMDYQVGDRGKTIINVNSQESYTVYTNWISETTANWISYEFFNSTEVYLLDDNGVISPIILDMGSITPKKRVNEKLINYQFSYSKAVQINTARG